MKKFIFLLILIFATLSPNLLLADDNGSETPQNRQTITKHKNDDNTNHLKSSMKIYFSYNQIEGESTFTLPATIEYIEIELNNLSTGEMYYDTVYSGYPVWHQILDVGEYYIMCITDNGDIYSGYIFI